jgi:hypothetical protein
MGQMKGQAGQSGVEHLDLCGHIVGAGTAGASVLQVGRVECETLFQLAQAMGFGQA